MSFLVEADSGRAGGAEDGPEANPSDPVASFEEVLKAELQCVAAARGSAPEEFDESEDADATGGGEAYARAEQMKLLGLSFSGGGIRSATFNLGVLQTLARYRLLERVDYLSTVSGGGYIGGWLSAWIHHAPGGVDEVGEKLRESLGERAGGGGAVPPEPEQIRYLRRYSNYLTPKMGLASGDTWAAVGIYLRNLLLNQLVLWFLLAGGIWALRGVHEGAIAYSGYAVGGVLWALGVLVVWLNSRPEIKESQAFGGLSGLWSAAFLLLAATFVVPELAAPESWRPPTPLLVVAALGLASLHVSDWMSGLSRKGVLAWLIGIALGTGVAATLMNQVPLLLQPKEWTSESKALQALIEFVLVLEGAEATTVWGGPLTLAAFSLGGALYMGVMSRELPAMRREWWGRFGGIAVGASAFWVMAMLITLAGLGWIQGAAGGDYTPLLAAIWAAVTGAGLYAGQSPATDGDEGSKLSKLATAAPYVFIVGLLIAISAATEGLLEVVRAGDSYIAGFSPTWLNLSLAGIALGVGAALTWRIDVNVFSLHGFYRNRLARCYQGGADPGNRTPDSFTGFAEADDRIELADLRDGSKPAKRGPYPLVNATLNLVGGENLAWQKRKGASFVLSPRYCGFGAASKRTTKPGSAAGGVETLDAYRPSKDYGGGLKLSSATAISGAAASPNMGYHSSAPLAFLMTVFNVRLGWWAANPKWESWTRRGPMLSLKPLLAELFGLSNENRDFVYLSDGGHFENLGIYELVRRRCRFIIACDAEADGAFEFDGLGNAIEKCRTDFGVDISIDTESIRKARETEAECRHCAVGRINYGDGFTGTLLYVKSSVTGDEPADVERYRAQNPDFPHQTTGDQWFDETQFESYRRLGQHAMESVLGAAVEREETATFSMQEIFLRLRRHWHAPSRRDGGAFTRHSQRFAEIMEDMAGNKHLAYLDDQFNPSWYLASKGRAVTPATLALPTDPAELRAGYYLCRRLIQLMEDVFIDLGLDEEHDHPDNHGWMNLFRNWSYAGVFRLTWTVTASTYGARFRDFCERRLGLKTTDLQTLSTLAEPTAPGPADSPDSLDTLRSPAVKAAYGIRASRPDSILESIVESTAPDQIELPSKLNFLEQEIARNVVRLYCLAEEKRGNHDPKPEVRLLETETGAVRHSEGAVRLPVGFAVLGDDRKVLVYLRIQDHLWSMGLGGRAIRDLGVRELYLPILELRAEDQASSRAVLPTAENFARFERLFDEATELERDPGRVMEDYAEDGRSEGAGA